MYWPRQTHAAPTHRLPSLTATRLSMQPSGQHAELMLCCAMLCPALPQTLASNGRFGRKLPIEQQTFLVLADTVLKQLDSLKSADAAVGGPVRR